MAMAAVSDTIEEGLLPVPHRSPFAAGHEETKLRLPSSPTRRRFLQMAAGVAATGALALAEDTAILEPNRPILTAIEVGLTSFPPAFDGFTIPQLSEYHYA